MGEALKIGITGLPGAGKTYCLLKVIEMLEGDGLKVGGMITEPIVKRNRREGFYVMDWATKEKRVFASREITSKTKVGRFGLDISHLEEFGVNAVPSAPPDANVPAIERPWIFRSLSSRRQKALRVFLCRTSLVAAARRPRDRGRSTIPRWR